MWIMLPDAFISVVEYVVTPPQPDKLLVRARVKGDLEKIFPRNEVERTADADYLYRTVVTRNQLKLAMLNEIDRIDYRNFKNSVPVEDKPRHDAYLRCWSAMMSLQTQLEPAAKKAPIKWYQRDSEPGLLDQEWDDWQKGLHGGDDQPVLPRLGVVGAKASKKARKVRRDAGRKRAGLPGKVVGTVV